MNETIIIGHKNPDTDSVCSAYCYSKLKNRISNGDSYLAGRCGNLNRQTKFIFNKFKIEPPEYIGDTYQKVCDIMESKIKTVYEDEPIYEVLKNVKELKTRITPVLCDNNKYKGIVSFFEISNLYLNQNITDKPKFLFRTCNFEKVIKGKVHKEGTKKEFLAQIIVGAMHFDHSIKHMQGTNAEETILIVGIRKTIIEYAIKNQIPALIITGVKNIKEIDIDFSNYNGCVYLSEVDSAETHRKLVLSIPVKSIMNKSLQHLSKGDYASVAQKKLLNQEHQALPVIDEDNLLGIVSRTDLLNKKKRKLILVDHNETSQSIDGAESSEIVEIIDHHRLGTIKTKNPIYVYAKPVGATCTLVHQLYKINNQDIPKNEASLLLAGIMSDTALLKSPTTTDEDLQSVKELSLVSGLDYETLGGERFSSSNSLKNRDPFETVDSDFKIYTEYGLSVGIGQTEVVTFNELNISKKGLFEALEKAKSANALNWAMILITDIVSEDSILLSTEFIKGEEDLHYTRKDKNIYYLPGVLSRKKQLLPEILRILEKITE